MQRIAHVISARNTIGGAERVVRALIHAGDAAGFEQVVLNPFVAGDSMDLIVPRGSATGYEATPGDGIRDLRRVRAWLRHRLGAFAPELIHVHLFHASVLVASLPAAGETARLLTHHHGDIFRAQGRRWEQWLDRFVTRRFDAVASVSEAVGSFLRDEYRLPRSRVVTIRNGWEGEPRLDVPKAPSPTVITIGNLRPEKGHSILLRAFALVLERIPDARLTVVGEGPERGALERLTDELGLRSGVNFTGATEEIWGLLGPAHVFALPSHVEQLGIAALEAMAAGVPVVASDVGGVSEIVIHETTGLLVPAGDPVALASSLLDLLTQPDKARAMGQRARLSVREMTMDKMSAAYLALYDRLLAAGS